ncbi:MAG TPA: HAD family hydrolase [Nitrospirota bacterium]|nr:HAD family hydrolase [Nitrospirota bacterium]
MNRAVFFDRDGTVTEEVGYLDDLSKLRLIPGAGHAIKALNRAGFRVVLVTNQSGVARGYFPESLVHEAHQRLEEMLAGDGARLDGIYYCPHHPTAGNSPYTIACDCRKPGTGLLERAARDLAVDLRDSFVVGDKWSDIELAHRAGARSILVRTGFGQDDPGNTRPNGLADPDHIAPDITGAVDWILKAESRGQRAEGR